MLEPSLFPESARFCYVRTRSEHSDLMNFQGLHPLEQSIVSRSVNVRKSEFGDARWCAHEALREAGYTGSEPILRGERGKPLWPNGFTGLDAEPAEQLPEGVLAMIARSGEIPQLERLRAAGIPFADRLLFCAKEATYKAWFPMTDRWLGFDQAEIDLREDGTLISYLLVRPTPVPFISGRWIVRDGYVVVATTVDINFP